MSTNSNFEWLDVEAAAEYLGSTVRHVRGLIAERRVRHYCEGRRVRFDRRDLDDYLAGCVREAVR